VKGFLRILVRLQHEILKFSAERCVEALACWGYRLLVDGNGRNILAITKRTLFLDVNVGYALVGKVIVSIFLVVDGRCIFVCSLLFFLLLHPVFYNRQLFLVHFHKFAIQDPVHFFLEFFCFLLHLLLYLVVNLRKLDCFLLKEGMAACCWWLRRLVGGDRRLHYILSILFFLLKISKIMVASGIDDLTSQG